MLVSKQAKLSKLSVTAATIHYFEALASKVIFKDQTVLFTG